MTRYRGSNKLRFAFFVFASSRTWFNANMIRIEISYATTSQLKTTNYITANKIIRSLQTGGASSSNKSSSNEQRVGVFAGISNAILQFGAYLICRNSYNSPGFNMLFIEIVEAIRKGRRKKSFDRALRWQDAPVHQ